MDAIQQMREDRSPRSLWTDAARKSDQKEKQISGKIRQMSILTNREVA